MTHGDSTASCIKSNIRTRCVFYVNKPWYLTLRDKGRLRVLANSVLREIFGAKDEVTGSGEDSTRKSFMICAGYQMLFI